MNLEELTKTLHEKYDGYFRKIDVTYVDYQYIPHTNEELIDTYIISWRPWKIVRDDDDMVMYSCEELLYALVEGELLDDKINKLFTKLNYTKTVSPGVAEMLKGCKTMLVQYPPRNLMEQPNDMPEVLRR